MTVYIKKITALCIIVILIFLIMIGIITNLKASNSTDVYTVKSYKNTVALYKNDEMIKIYESVVLNTLPQKDIQELNIGIAVSSPSEAENILEDYDG